MKTRLKNVISIIFCMSLISFITPPSASADESNNQSEYEKLFEVMGGKANYDKLIDTILTQLKISFNKGVDFADQKSSNLTPETKMRIRNRLKTIMSDAMEQLRTTLPQAMPYEQLVKEVYVPIYIKHFSPEEVRKIISFYESPVGKKFVHQQPAMMQEISVKINQDILPKLLEVARKSDAKTRAKINKEIGKIVDKKKSQ